VHANRRSRRRLMPSLAHPPMITITIWGQPLDSSSRDQPLGSQSADFPVPESNHIFDEY
jgi:hypothetical protein